MTDRAELIEAGNAALEARYGQCLYPDDMAVILDAVEEEIRADERADLRAKVEALPTVGGVTMPYVKGAEHRYELIYRGDVLTLLNRGAE